MGKLEIGTPDDPYLTRRRIIQTPLFGVLIHKIHREDRDPDPHDHPWWFLSIILSGWYKELVWPDKHHDCGEFERTRRRWSAAITRRKAAHIITEISSPLRTLVFTGPRSREGWGFWRPGAEYVPWQEYVDAN